MSSTTSEADGDICLGCHKEAFASDESGATAIGVVTIICSDSGPSRRWAAISQEDDEYVMFGVITQGHDFDRDTREGLVSLSTGTLKEDDGCEGIVQFPSGFEGRETTSLDLCFLGLYKKVLIVSLESIDDTDRGDCVRKIRRVLERHGNFRLGDPMNWQEKRQIIQQIREEVGCPSFLKGQDFQNIQKVPRFQVEGD